jgi:predicted porin
LRKSLLSLAPLALGAFVGTAFADDSSVTLYGTIDAAVANIQKSFNFDANMVAQGNPVLNHGQQSATGMFSGGLTPSNWGIKGQEDLGGGAKAFFQLESGFNIGSGALGNAALALSRNTADTGPAVNADSALNGQLFARGAWVGIGSGELGSIQAGRNTSFLLDDIVQTDPLMGSYAFSPIGYSGVYGGGGYTDDSRVDNSLKYKLSISDFSLGVLYKFGGVAGANGAQGAYQINLSYVSGPLGVYGGYAKFKDGSSLAGNGAGGLTATFADTDAFLLSAKFSLDSTGTTIRGGYEHETYKDPSNPTQDLAITSLYGIGITGTNNVFPFASNKQLNVYWLGVDQDLGSGFMVMAAIYHVSQNSYNSDSTSATTHLAGTPKACPSAGGSNCSGTTNYFSLVGDYRFSKRTDTYLGIMKTTASGGMGFAYQPTSTLPDQAASNRIIALGLRHKF